MSPMRSFSKQMTASALSRNRASASFAWAWRRLPSKANGNVAKTTMSEPASRATCATAGAAPEPARDGAPARDLVRRHGTGDRLHIGVDRDQVGLVQAIEHNPVEHIRAG